MDHFKKEENVVGKKFLKNILQNSNKNFIKSDKKEDRKDGYRSISIKDKYKEIRDYDDNYIKINYNTADSNKITEFKLDFTKDKVRRTSLDNVKDGY